MSSLFDEMMEEICEKNKQISDLEAKLAEKEKLIEDYSAFFNQLFNQDKISFCIEQLEKVKEKLRQNITITAPVGELKKLKDYLIGVDDFIDNQIKQLKEMK